MNMRQGVKRGITALLALALLALPGCGGDEDKPVTVQPQMGDLVQRVEETGTVVHRDTTPIFAQVNGQILSCLVEEGQTVQAGDVLYQLDRGDLDDQIVQAQLSLASAQESLRQAEKAGEDLRVVSYTSGVVTQIHVNPGDYVSAGTPVAQVVDSRNLKLTVPFTPEDAQSISAGAAAVIVFPQTGEELSGQVVRVYPNETVLTSGRRGVYVELSFSNPGAVSSGTQAQAKVGSAACMEAGSVEYAADAAVYASQAGRVASVAKQEGESISQGQVLLTLENDSITNAIASAVLGVESAQVSLDQLQAKGEDYTVTAPADGVIISRTAKTGDYAAAANTLATLAQPDSLQVQVEIDELLIHQVSAGQTADITFTDGDGTQRTYTGRVERVNDAGVSVGGVTSYVVEIGLEDSQGLKDGMNVQVSIVTQQVENCMLIPSSAVTNGTVRVLREGKEQVVSVETGASGDGWVEIVSGLTLEDQVIVG